MEYTCRIENEEKENWSGNVGINRSEGDQYELEITGRGSRFYVIVGKSFHGNYICIPDWDVGSYLASWRDVFWNSEKLSKYMSPVDAVTLAEGLKAVDSILSNR